MAKLYEGKTTTSLYLLTKPDGVKTYGTIFTPEGESPLVQEELELLFQNEGRISMFQVFSQVDENVFEIVSSEVEKANNGKNIDFASLSSAINGLDSRSPLQLKIELLVTNNLGYLENRYPYYSLTRNAPQAEAYKSLRGHYSSLEAKQEWGILS